MEKKASTMNPFLKNNSAFELKGSLVTLTVMHLLSGDINLFIAQLRYHAQKTPNLFKNMPLILDLQRINALADCDIDFGAVQHQLRQYGLVPVGVRHGNEKQNTAAQTSGLAILSANAHPTSSPKTSTPAAPKPEAEVVTHTKVITKPVRSGQQIYARKSNLVVLAPVSHGAELLADGCIHVYGILYGRALAGVSGDKTARIFCQRLEAELVSIAGYYKLRDDLPSIDSSMTQVYLEDEKIQVNTVFEKITSEVG